MNNLSNISDMVFVVCYWCKLTSLQIFERWGSYNVPKIFVSFVSAYSGCKKYWVKVTEDAWIHTFNTFLTVSRFGLANCDFFCLPSHCITIIYESLLSSSDKLWRYLMAVIIYLQGAVWMTKRIVKQTNEKKISNEPSCLLYHTPFCH